MTSDDSPSRRLEDAIRAARAGNRHEAYQLLRRVIDADPSNEAAWLWLAAVTDQPREARLALRRVEQLNPANPRLAEARRWLEARLSAPPSAVQVEVEPIEPQPAAPAVGAAVAAAPETTGSLPASEIAAPQAAAPGIESEAAPAEPVAEAVALWETATTETGREGIAVTPGVEVVDLPEASSGTVDLAEGVEPLAPLGEETEAALPKMHDTKPVPPVAPPAESGAEPTGEGDTAPRPPMTQEPPIVPAPEGRPRRACRFWLTVALALALATALAMLAFVVWLRSDASGFGLLSTPTPDAPQRALALQPDANLAIAEARWADAVAALEAIYDLDPANATWQHSAANAYYQLGVEQRRAGDLAAALASLQRAAELAPDAPVVQQERQQATAMLEGLRHYNERDWAGAIAAFTPVHRADPAFADVTEWLYSAYFNQGAGLQAKGALPEAEQAYQAALALRPDRLTVRQRVEEITWLLRPPTPTVTPTPAPTPTPTATPTPDPATQLILVDISDQRMYVYENDELLWEWVASTGEPGKDTATGRYQVLDKIEVAYASTWNLDMPYWLGIYHSGPLENGIHALPINRATGLRLWEGLLGQRVSFGCVVLSDENARTLFEWAQVGTPVVIQW
jgi:lipoprotein-anchoring transpeptidase ErfK/SrfK